MTDPKNTQIDVESLYMPSMMPVYDEAGITLSIRKPKPLPFKVRVSMLLREVGALLIIPACFMWAVIFAAAFKYLLGG